jgi:hypothetical protein
VHYFRSFYALFLHVLHIIPFLVLYYFLSSYILLQLDVLPRTFFVLSLLFELLSPFLLCIIAAVSCIISALFMYYPCSFYVLSSSFYALLLLFYAVLSLFHELSPHICMYYPYSMMLIFRSLFLLLLATHFPLVSLPLYLSLLWCSIIAYQTSSNSRLT